jgi:hypothetical protein
MDDAEKHSLQQLSEAVLASPTNIRHEAPASANAHFFLRSNTRVQHAARLHLGGCHPYHAFYNIRVPPARVFVG